MASREASLKVTLQPASFQSGLRRMVSMTKSAGTQMGQALKGPMTAGLKGARTQISGMMSSLKNGLKTAATLGGALSFGLLAKDALQMQNTYRNIAFNVNKVAGNAESWESIQSMINSTVQKTGRSASALSEAFTEVFEATGSLEFAKESMKVIGTTATATGHSIGALATTMQLASRKFGIGADGAADAMTRMIEKTGVGGKGIEQLTNRFALVAGEASNAGFKGAEGISELLGVMLLLDSSIGEKADPGLKMMFQTLKGGSTQFIALKKKMTGFKFEADMTAMDKIKALLQSKGGRAEAEKVFTADARVVYDELAKPFDDAMQKALEQGFLKQEAMQIGLEAFDKNLADSAKSTMKYSEIQDEAANRQKTDPLVKMNKALAKISDAFTRPKMIEAMSKLADHMPALADAVANALEIFLDNPWASVAAIVGAKIALGFAASAAAKGVATGMSAIAGGAVSGMGGLGAGAAASAGVGGTLAAGGAASAAAAAAAVVAAAAVGVLAGKVLYEEFLAEAHQDIITSEFGALEGGERAVELGGEAVRSGDQEKIALALETIKTARASMKENESVLNTIASSIANVVSGGGITSAEELRMDTTARLDAQEKQLKAAMMTAGAAFAGAAMTKMASAPTTRGPLTPAAVEPGALPTAG